MEPKGLSESQMFRISGHQIPVPQSPLGSLSSSVSGAPRARQRQAAIPTQANDTPQIAPQVQIVSDQHMEQADTSVQISDSAFMSALHHESPNVVMDTSDAMVSDQQSLPIAHDTPSCLWQFSFDPSTGAH